MPIPSPTANENDRRAECARIVQDIVLQIEREALDAGWSAAELAEAFTRYAQGAQLRAVPAAQYQALANDLIDTIIRKPR